MAIIHPFSVIYGWLRSHSSSLLYLTWILGCAFSSIWVKHTGVVPIQINNFTYYECRYDNNGLTPFESKIYIAINFIFTFALPLIVLLVSYTAITRKLLADSMGEKDAPLRRITQMSNRNKVCLQIKEL